MYGAESLVLIASIAGLIAVIVLPYIISARSAGNLYLFLRLFPLVISFMLCLFRWITSGHPPFAGLYEGLLLLSFLLQFGLLFAYPPAFREQGISRCPPAAYGTVLVITVIAVSLPLQYREIKPLQDILLSPWFYVHVPLALVGYLFCILALVKESDDAVKLIRAAILFLGAGIVSGAVWGFFAWGRFWNWDPKETGSLAVWLILVWAGHSKTDRTRTVLLILATLACAVNFVVLTLFVRGLHSYG